MSVFAHMDVDGDMLMVYPAHVPDEGPGVNFRTDFRGSTVLLKDIPELLEEIQDLAAEAAESWEEQ